ncbi:MAG: hypothetical protein NVSMB39_2750 [Candidatus Saccharimonadales bacterium]
MNADFTNNQPLPSKKASVGRYWKTILSNLPDSVIVYDPDGNVVYANALAAKDLRYTSVEELMLHDFDDIIGRFVIHDEHGHLINGDDLPTKKAMRQQTIAAQTVQFALLGDPASFWLVAKAFPINDRHKELKFVVSTYYEVTSFKEAEAQLRDSNKRMLSILDELIDLDVDK